MADQNNDNDNAAADNNAGNLNVAEGNADGGDIWDEIFDPNFVPDPNAYDYEAHHEVLFQNLQALQQENMYIFQNGFPMPQQIDVQPEPVAHSSSFQPSGFNEAQPVQDSLPAVSSSIGNYIPGASSVLPHMEGWGYVNEAYQSDCSSLSEFVASSESQQEASLTATREVHPVEGRHLEIPEGWVRGVSIPAFMRRFDDSAEKDPRNPPNTPVNARSGLNVSSRSLDCSPNFPTSPGLCLRSAIRVLRSISEENKDIQDIERAEGRKGAKSRNSASKIKAKSSVVKVHVKRKSRDDQNEENIQISLSEPKEQDSEGADKLFIKFGSFMVILVLLFPLAIIACLQGLLPEKYAFLFLTLLILSILGACYCFFKACYVRNEDDEPDSTANSTVRYGSIQSPKPGPSNEPA